ncbi:MAG: relaxase/mobilization nuclease domain-containing protein [Clostridia bacterium]|nr:relaxase/mobilization nuclease domain-containing protein [Clostridia bacterium]
MAVTKIKPIKGTLNKALEYIQNPEKTEGKTLVHSFGCSAETADIEFEYTISQAIQKGNNLAHHLIQSFAPGEVDYETAHKIGIELADKVTKGQYEYVLTTHIDKGHIHNHIIFCAVNFVTHQKYNSNKNSYYNIRKTSDKLCQEYGLSVVSENDNKGKSYTEYTAEKTGVSWKKNLRIAIDLLILQVSSKEELLEKLQAMGYEIKRGKYISCKAPNQAKFIRLKTLGINYTETAIVNRIMGGKKIQNITNGVSLIIDIQNNLNAKNNKGYEHWAKIHNLKQASKTLNFLTENHIESYESLVGCIERFSVQKDNLSDKIKSTEKEISEVSLLLKSVTNYNQTKHVHDGYIHAKNKTKYKEKHESELLIFEAAKKELQPFLDTKTFPSPVALKNKLKELHEQKNDLYIEYRQVKEKLNEYSLIKQNVDSILSIDTLKKDEKAYTI